MENKSLTAIMILTSYCNLDCIYCYSLKGLIKPKGVHVMDMSIIDSAIRQLSDLPYERIDFNWHGGEPLLAELETFKEIINIQKTAFSRNRKIFYNKIQTNATLLSEEWAEYFKENDFGVGISIDGPLSIQNRNRPYPLNKNSFEDVMRGINVFREYNLHGGCLAVITSNTIQYIDEFFRFFKNECPKFDIIPCFHIDKTSGEVIPPTISPGEFGEFLIKLFTLWLEEDDPKIEIRFFEEILHCIFGGRPTLCSINNGCNSFITVNWNGDVYLCDTFCDYENFWFGNLIEQNLKEILTTNKYKAIIKMLGDLSMSCKNCQWVKLCMGGCKYQAYMPGYLKKEYYYCQSRKRLYSHINKSFQAKALGLKKEDI